MTFNSLFFLLFIFVLLPALIKRLEALIKRLELNVDERVQKWLDINKLLERVQKCLDINKLLELAFSKVPRFQYSSQISFILGIIFTYLSLTSDSILSLVAYILSLVFFVYLAYLHSDDLFDTFSNTIITFLTFYLFYNLISSSINYFFVETDWTIIFKNRRYILLGPYFINSETGDEVWRFWPPLYALLILVCSGYGTLRENKYKFLIPYGIFSIIFIFALMYDEDYYSEKNQAMISNRGYDATESAMLLIGALVTGLLSYLLTRNYCFKLGEHQVNYWQNTLIYLSFAGFLGTLLILDPPGESGVRPSAWGGFVLNLIFAFGSLFIGFGIGVALAFGRRSSFPIFSIPSVGIIELVRAGPLVAWLFFAQFMFPDLMSPIWDAEFASRIILVFSFFFGCYLAEIIRGGLQSVPHGQYEAATALGLSPTQIKLQIQLPQAVRTTLPAIVSQMIAMLKDTSLVYFFGIRDVFKAAQDIPQQKDFLGQDFDALIFIGMMFWVLAFYLSQISRRIEKSLGLINEGEGEVT